MTALRIAAGIAAVWAAYLVIQVVAARYASRARRTGLRRKDPVA